MELDRIAALLRPFWQENEHGEKNAEMGRPFPGAVLSEHQLQSILTYINILLRWNARTNLTAIRDPEEIITRHFGESLFAARHLFPQDHVSLGFKLDPAAHNPAEELGAPRLSRTLREGGELPNDQRRVVLNDLLDLGSGAGFPGLPIKIWTPHIHLTLVESNQKKATFLKEVCRALTLTDVNVLAIRAEMPHDNPPASPDHSSAKANLSPRPIPIANVVTLRAVEGFDQALSIADSLVAPKGRLALLISRQQLSIAQTQASSYVWQNPTPIPQSSSRILLIGKRI